MLTDEKIANELKRRNAKALRDLVKKVTTAQNIDKQIRATKIKLENLIETRHNRLGRRVRGRKRRAVRLVRFPHPCGVRNHTAVGESDQTVCILLGQNCP